MPRFTACDVHERPPSSPAPSPRGAAEGDDTSILEGSFATSAGPGPAASVADIGDPPESQEACVTALATQSFERRILVGDSHGRVTVFTEVVGVNSDDDDGDGSGGGGGGWPGGAAATITPRSAAGRPVGDAAAAAAAAAVGGGGKRLLRGAAARPPAVHLARYSHLAFRTGVDCLSTKPVDPRVTQVLLLPRRSPGVTVHLTSNVNTVKLFQIRDRSYTMAPRSSVVLPRRIYSATAAHKKCIIHSLALCADGETFFSADDLEANWWDVEASAPPALLLQLPDPGPAATTALTVHSLAAHPSHGSLYLAALSDATVFVGDLRIAPTTSAGRPAGGLGFSAPPSLDGLLFARRPAAFLDTDRCIVTRDMYSLQVWDARAPSAPIATKQVLPSTDDHQRYLDHMKHEYDHPTLAVDSETQTVATGVYNGQVAVWSPCGATSGARDLAAPLEFLSLHGSRAALRWAPTEDMVPVHAVSISNGADVVAFTDGDKWYKFTR